MSPWWWLQNRAYFKFVIRELTSIFVAAFAVLTLWQIRVLGQGPDAYVAFANRLGTPGFAVLNSVALVFVLYHSMTLFNLAPTAVVVRVGDKRVPNWLIAGMHYVAFMVLSAVVAWVLLK